MTNAISGKGLPLVTAALVLLLFLIAACGDDDSTGSSTPRSATPTNTASVTSGTSQATDTATITQAPASNVDTDLLSQLRNLSKKLADATGKVTYRFDSDASGEQFIGTTTIYFKEGSSRTDFSSDEGTYTIISTSAASYFCTASSGQGFCSQGQGGLSGVSQLPFVQSFSDDERFEDLIAGLSGVNSAGSRDIAGTEVNCFDFSGDFGSGPGTGTLCVTDDALVFLAHFDADNGDTFNMEASEVSESVSDSDFDPPYPVTP